MLSSAVLDTALGLMFVFALTSLCVTSMTELLASMMRWRSRNLAVGIRHLLDTDDRAAGSTALYGHALIKSLYRAGTGKLPSYIPADLFAKALLDIALHPGDAADAAARKEETVEDAVRRNRPQIGDRAADAILALARRLAASTKSDLDKLEKLEHGVAQWFDHAMDRCSGWYKRKTQFYGLMIALVVAAAANIDAFEIGRVLARDPVLRAATVASADKAIAAAAPSSSASAAPDASAAAPAPSIGEIEKRVRDVHDLGIPIGWEKDVARFHDASVWWWLSKVLGIVLTGLAASLGAPFWFDMLQKVMTLRSTGVSPEEKEKRKQKAEAKAK